MSDRPDIFKSTDPWLFAALLSIVIFGLIMLASASAYMSDHVYGWAFHFLLLQLVYLMIGVAVLGVVVHTTVAQWQSYCVRLFLLGLVLLLLVRIPGIGHHVNGSWRWVGFGPLHLQVSEFMKFAMILFISDYLVRNHDEIRNDNLGFLKPMALLGVVALLLLLEPDFGALVVITASVMTMMFMAGARVRPFIILIIGVAILFSFLVVMDPYRLARLVGFLHPWADPNGKSYQLTESLIGFGRGGFFGVGLGNGIQKLFYLPEADTDFIFEVVTEELGLLGALILIGLFVVFIWRILLVGKRAQLISESFSAYIAYGIAIWFGMQFMVNIGVGMGALPTKGLTLPFMSYGGSSLVMDCLAMGLIFRIDYETRRIASGIQGRRV